ncbi:unnamed protein product, partial [Meganyctiphanes norvegica]
MPSLISDKQKSNVNHSDKQKLQENVRYMPRQSVQQNITPMPKQRQIVIWTECRSGSSFVANILSVGRGTFFLYEPIQTLHGEDEVVPEDAGKLGRILNNMLHCNISDQGDYWDKHKKR